MQTSDAKSENKHSDIKHFSTLKERIISYSQLNRNPSLSIINKH